MCGIAGVLKRSGPVGPAEHAEVAILLEAMRHRGPDARAVRACEGWALLGANRLRITDAQNRAADMPLLGADGRSAIVFNGEIYNHRELRRELATYPFRTASDTECILAAYGRWGRHAVDHLEGMFAFALYDAQRNEVFIACDATGQKTLYLWQDDEHLVFASELDALVADPYRPKRLHLEALAEFVAQRFILGADTHLCEVQKLEAGTWVCWSLARREAARYHHAPRGDLSRDDAEAISAELCAAVTGASRAAFAVEVPHALLLSGGIDSAAVLALARAAGLQPSTFSIGFATDGLTPQPSSAGDELPLARRLARELGTDHTEITLSAEAYCEALDLWTDIAGEPLGSQEAPCLLKLFESASAGARVVFCGSGPDELFDGYSYGARLAGTPLAELPSRYAGTFHWAGEADFERLMPGRAALQLVANKLERLLGPYRDWPLDAVHAVQLLHFHGRLGAYEFRQLDLTSMRRSVEARSPLATRALVRVAFGSASRWLHQDGEEKWIYKRALTGLVPAEVVARKKLGFPVPSAIWRSRPFIERAQILFEPGAHLTGCGLVEPTYLRTLWESPSPATRNLFSRLYTAERILRRQAAHCGRSARG